MQTHPLTHHEILTLVEPFARCGRQVDLASSNRIERRINFKPVGHAFEVSEFADIQETLKLESLRSGYRLTRTLTLPCGLQASLFTDGPDPGELLARIETLAPLRQFTSHAGILVAHSYRLDVVVNSARNGTSTTQTVLTRGEAQIEDLTLILNAATVRGYPAEIELAPKPGSDVDLPEDLFAVIGWGWGPLRKITSGWRGNLKVPASEPARSRQIELKLEKAVSHLVRTLAAPPRSFHDSLLRARWGVVFRRAIPLLTFGGMIAGAGALSFVQIPEGSILNLMIMGTPPLLLFSAFGMRDRPPLEIPAFPRPSKATAWRTPPHPSSPQMATPPAHSPLHDDVPSPCELSPRETV